MTKYFNLQKQEVITIGFFLYHMIDEQMIITEIDSLNSYYIHGFLLPQVCFCDIGSPSITGRYAIQLFKFPNEIYVLMYEGLSRLFEIAKN